jgi:hypothetical protein
MALGPRLGHPRATQASRKGHPWVECGWAFVFNKKLKKGGWGGRAKRAYRRNRTSSPTSRVIGKAKPTEEIAKIAMIAKIAEIEKQREAPKSKHG